MHLELSLKETFSIPFSRSYWVVPGRLLAGPYPGDLQPDNAARRIFALLDCGIRRVINLMEANAVNHQGQLFVPYADHLHTLAVAQSAEIGEQVSWTRYAIPDGGIPSQELMHLILDDIDTSLAANRPVYVHCWGGSGRTATVVGCYLIRHNLATAENILARIKQLRQDVFPYKESPETDEQREFARSWEVGI